jgi:hypothetical protein
MDQKVVKEFTDWVEELLKDKMPTKIVAYNLYPFRPKVSSGNADTG